MPGIRLIALLVFFMALLSGCAKEYSYERMEIPPTDTTGGGGNNTNPPGICAACIGNDSQVENRWSLHVGNMFYCGIIDTVIAAPQRSGFTFFGPSACSADSGMVITVYLNGQRLNQDISNYTTDKVGFYYYDNVTPSYMLITQGGQPFRLTIDSYEESSQMMRGQFSGHAVTANGGSMYISDGKFKVKVR